MQQPESSAPIEPFRDGSGELIHIGAVSAGAGSERLLYPLQSSSVGRALKRAVDLLGASAVVILLSPFLILLLLVVGIGTRGHPIFVQERLGRSGVPFRIFKLRTMSRESHERLLDRLQRDERLAHEWAIGRKLRDDPRVTRLGRILRKYSLDELPQLINVLLGQMSLVGPRPIVADEVRMFGSLVTPVLSVRPGLTGLWGISGRNDLDYTERVALEHEYVARWTLGLDISILLKTIPRVINGRGAY